MQYKTLKRLLRIKLVYKSIHLSRQLKLPGFEGLSLYLVLKFFFQGIKNGSLNMRASSLAFSFFLALFPLVIFLFTLIPYIPIENFQESLFELIESILPKSAFEATKETIEDIIQNPHGGLLSFGFISALYFSTNGFNAMMDCFNETYHSINTHSAIGQRLISLGLVFILTLMVSTAIALIIFTEVIIPNYIPIGFIATFFIHFGKYFVLIALCLFFISFNYYLGSPRNTRFRFLSPGSIFATFLVLITCLLFAYYINNFSTYNKLYGSIGTLLVVLLWIYITSFILLLGFDLNVSIIVAKTTKRNTLSTIKMP